MQSLFVPSFLFSSVSGRSSFSLPHKNLKPSSPSPSFNPSPSPSMARTHRGKALSNRKSPHPQQFSSIKERRVGPTCRWLHRLLHLHVSSQRVWLLLLYPHTPVLYLFFGLLKSMDLKSVGLRFDSTLLLSTSKKP